jgi:hypothetical protein
VGAAPAEPAPKKTRKKAAAEMAPAATTAEEGLHIFVDCTTTKDSKSLNDWAQEQADFIARQYSAPDIRCGALDSPIGYEKWTGVLSAFIRDPQASPLPAGAYTMETRFSKVLQVVAEALYLRVKVAGGTYTRGVR